MYEIIFKIFFFKNSPKSRSSSYKLSVSYMQFENMSDYIYIYMYIYTYSFPKQIIYVLILCLLLFVIIINKYDVIMRRDSVNYLVVTYIREVNNF